MSGINVQCVLQLGQPQSSFQTGPGLAAAALRRLLLQDGSTIQAYKLLLAVTSPVFEGFFRPLADRGLREVRVEDMKAAGFRRLLHFVYNSRCLSWKVE